MVVTFSLNWQFHYLKFVTQNEYNSNYKGMFTNPPSTNNQTRIKWKLHRKSRLAVFRYHCSALYFSLHFYIYDIYLCQFILFVLGYLTEGISKFLQEKTQNVHIFPIPCSSSLRQWSAKCLLLHKCCLY